MTPSSAENQREQIQQAIAAQENLRGQVDDAIIDSTIAALQDKLAALDDSPEQQRKLVTILFMDIADHTALTSGMDPEDQMALVDPLISRLAENVDEFGGHVARYQGDGFKAVFGLPVARENDPEQAIRAGLAIQEEAEVIASELESEQGLTGFMVRVGITSGQVFAGGETEGEDTIKGPPVNLAARLESAAEPGTVLISYDTYKFVRGIFTLETLKPLQVKGFSEPVQVYRVLGAKPRAFYRGMRMVEGIETRMVGRDAELEILRDAFYTMIEEDQLQFVTIVGEAGLGKSRLLYEFENWVDLRPLEEDVLLFRGRAHLETQRMPYDLLRSIFAFRFRIQDSDPLEIVQEKWLSGFGEAWDSATMDLSTNSGIDVELRAHFLGQLLGYNFANSPHVRPILGDPQQMRDRSLVYLEDYFKATTQRTPVLALLEDLHWADGSSLDVLSRLGLELADAPILFVAAARPGLYERRPYWFEGRDFHRRLNLKPLSKRLNRQLVREVMQMVPDIPESLSDLILTNSEGNPFYVEELVKVFVEAGVILRTDPHWKVDEKRLSEMDVPSTLTGVLQARLERLPKTERSLIQQASVVGRVFWDQAVWYLNHQADGELKVGDIEQGLYSLRERELIYRRELSSFLDAQEYIFKHAVLRQVTYESVLKKLRRVYHALAAEWLMEQHGDRSGEVVGLIADHLELAGKQKEALRYLQMAGAEAAGRYANNEAVEYFSRALVLADEEDLETRFELLLTREEVLDLQSKREAQFQDLDALKILAKELRSEEKQLEVGVRFSAYFRLMNDFQSAAATAERTVKQGEAINDLLYIARGHQRWGTALIWMEEYDSAQDHLQIALNGFRDTKDKRQEGATLRMLGLIAADLQDLQGWDEYARQALSIARQIGDRSAEAEAINHLANISFSYGKYTTAERYFKQYLAISNEIGSKNQERMALGNLAWVANAKQDFSSALDLAMQALDIAIMINDQLGEAVVQLNLGYALYGQDRLSEAEQAFLRALDLYEEIGVEWGLAESRTRIAKTLLVKGDIDGALKYVEAILPYLEKGKGETQTHNPVVSYLICFQVLSAADDPRALDVLAKGHANLQKWASIIKDPDLRGSYLENVPWNRELVELWEEQGEK